VTETTSTVRAASPTGGRAIGEWAIAVGLLVIGGLTLRDGLDQPESRSASGVGAGFVPEVVGVFLMILSVLLMVQIARGRVGEPDEGEGDVDVRSTRWVPLAACVAAVILFIVAVDPVGYPIIGALSFWITAWAMGARNHVHNAIIAITLTLVVYLVFTRVLGIDLPAGALDGVLA
jgi:putative tricarboxylic transport membrane protein